MLHSVIQFLRINQFHNDIQFSIRHARISIGQTDMKNNKADNLYFEDQI